MKAIELKRKSSVGKFYEWNYGYLPTDTCSLYRNIFFAILCLPFSWWINLLMTDNHSKDSFPLIGRVFFGLVGQLLLILSIVGVHEKYFINQGVIYYLLSFLIVIGYALGAIITLFICIAPFVLIENLTKKRRYKYSQPSALSVMIKSFKEKHCSRIDWKD
jgi:hypothetical protein